MITFLGQWYGANTSKKTTVLVKAYESGTVEIVEEANKQHILISDIQTIKISSRLGKTPRYLRFAMGEQLETSDNDAVDRWLKLAQPAKGFGLLHQLESHWRFVAFSLVLVVAIMWATVQYAVPAVSSTIAHALPTKTLNIASRETLLLLDKQFFDESTLSAERQKTLQQHFARILAQHPETPITVLFRASDKLGANAFALPDGTVVFTDDMVNLAEHDDELLSILGHEIGHVVYRHSLRSIVQNSMFVFLLALITGDVSGTTELVLGLPVIFSQLAYSRQYELEADGYSREWMINNDIPLHRFADIMTRVTHRIENENTEDKKVQTTEQHKHDDTEPSWSKYLSTHPGLQERLTAFE